MMLTKTQTESLQKLAALMGVKAAINLALVLCGARMAFIYDFPKVFSETHQDDAAKEALAAFKNLRCIGPTIDSPPTFYDPKKANKADVDILKNTKSSSAAIIAAQGRLLGFAGTAVFPSPDRLQVQLMCSDSKGKSRQLTAYGAYPREVYAAMEAFQKLHDKAAVLKGVRIAKGVVIKDFSLLIGSKEIKIIQPTVSAKSGRGL